MIELDNVTLQYPYDEFAVLKNVSFTLCDGLNTVLADVQSGKTSLCRMLVGDIKPTSGQIRVDGQPLDGISNANLDILYLTAKPSFFNGRSILYNIAYPLQVRRVSKAVRRGIASELADRFGISQVQRKVKLLTAEECKRVALARGLTVPRKRVLWDDFFDGVDLQTAQKALSLFGDGVSHVIVTSDARLAMGNTIVLDGGEVYFCGSADEARRQVVQLHWLKEMIGSK